jgi:hypothetical protein
MNLSWAARNLFADNGSKLVIAKYGTGGCGVFRTTWKNLSVTQQAGLVSMVREVKPRLLELFESLQKMITAAFQVSLFCGSPVTGLKH